MKIKNKFYIENINFKTFKDIKCTIFKKKTSKFRFLTYVLK